MGLRRVARRIRGALDLGCDVIDSGFEVAEVDAIMLDDEGAADDEDAEASDHARCVRRSRGPATCGGLDDTVLLQGDARRSGELRAADGRRRGRAPRPHRRAL